MWLTTKIRVEFLNDVDVAEFRFLISYKLKFILKKYFNQQEF